MDHEYQNRGGVTLPESLIEFLDEGLNDRTQFFETSSRNSSNLYSNEKIISKVHLALRKDPEC